MPIHILFEDNKLIRKGRPPFSASTNKKISVVTGLEDRRHILHGATQISNVLIDSFNRVIQKKGLPGLRRVVNALQRKLKSKGYKLTMTVKSSLEDKIKEIITIAFGKEENLVAGLSVENQGIEKARKSIKTIKSKLDDYCAVDIKSLAEIKSELIKLINTRLRNGGSGNTGAYSAWILKILKTRVMD